MKGKCENCGRSTPGRWVCDTCAAVFDGENYHNELLPEGYLDKEDDEQI